MYWVEPSQWMPQDFKSYIIFFKSPNFSINMGLVRSVKEKFGDENVNVDYIPEINGTVPEFINQLRYVISHPYKIHLIEVDDQFSSNIKFYEEVLENIDWSIIKLAEFYDLTELDNLVYSRRVNEGVKKKQYEKIVNRISSAIAAYDVKRIYN